MNCHVSLISRLLAVAAFCVPAAGCGGGAEATAVRAGPTIIITEEGIGISPIIRPAAATVHLALWIDAGCRDVSPSQIATVAAWIAASRAGGATRAFATPDGIELSLSCRSDDLLACLKRLGAALATRNPGPAEVRQAVERLVKARRAAEAADGGREADRLAMSALLGPAAQGFFPFGEEDGDAAITPAAIDDFLKDHFGPGRSLLVAVGDLRQEALAEFARKAFQNAPGARAARANRDLQPLPGGVKVAVDFHAAAAVAVAAPDQDAAAAAARDLADSIAATPGRPGGFTAVGFAARVRGGALALVRASGAEPAQLVRRAAFEMARVQAEGIQTVTSVSTDESLSALAREVGLRWSARSASRLSGTYGPGIGILVEGGRGDRLAGPDPDAELRNRTGDQMERAFLQARQAASAPQFKGQVDERSASVTVSGGARIEVRRHAGGRVAIAMRLAGGAGLDPARLNGRSALLATLTTTACARWPAERLAGALDSLDASLAPVVDGGSWGLTLTAPAEKWREALDIAIGCAIAPSFRPEDILRARLRLRERLGAAGADYWFSSRAAQLISPTSPGLVAPWGWSDSIANVSDAELARYAAQSAVASRIATAVVGDVPVKEVVDRIARRVGYLPAGALPEGVQAGNPVLGPGELKSRGTESWVVAAWRGPGSESGADGAYAFVSLIRAALGRQPGIEPVWQGAGGENWGSWAALGLKVSDQQLPNIDRILAAVAESIGRKPYDELVDHIAERVFVSDSETAVRPEFEAERIARNRYRGVERRRSIQQIRQVARGLLSAKAGILVAPMRNLK